MKIFSSQEILLVYQGFSPNSETPMMKFSLVILLFSYFLEISCFFVIYNHINAHTNKMMENNIISIQVLMKTFYFIFKSFIFHFNFFADLQDPSPNSCLFIFRPSLFIWHSISLYPLLVFSQICWQKILRY